MACHEKLNFGGWKKGNAADEVWKGTQLRGCKFVGVAVELGRKRKVRVGSVVVLVAFDVLSLKVVEWLDFFDELHDDIRVWFEPEAGGNIVSRCAGESRE